MANRNRLEAEPVDHVALLAEVGDRLVRRLANQSGTATDALFAVVYQRRESWDITQWTEALAELDASSLTVREWLALEAHNRRRERP